MKKIRLDLDAIKVETFSTAQGPEQQGTVDAHMASKVGDTWCVTCFDPSCADCSIPEYLC